MAETMQQDRVIEEWRTLTSLAETSPLLSVRDVSGLASGDASGFPHRIELTFSGKGIATAGPELTQIEITEQHLVSLELNKEFPGTAPTIQVVSLLFHPNVAAGGHINLPDIGLTWQEEMTLDVVCERMWDVVRGAWIDLENFANPAAGRWYAAQKGVSMPVDNRALDDPACRVEPSNIIRYFRRSEGPASAQHGDRPRPVHVIVDDREHRESCERLNRSGGEVHVIE